MTIVAPIAIESEQSHDGGWSGSSPTILEVPSPRYRSSSSSRSDEPDDCRRCKRPCGRRPLGRFEGLIDETDDGLSIELDVGWANAAGYDPIALLERLEGRVPLVHLEDVAAGRPVELGTGEVDVEAAAAAARDAGAEWLLYEHDEPSDPAASLEHWTRTPTVPRE